MSVPLHDLRALAAKSGWLGAVAVFAAVALAGCANQAYETHYAHGKEYFSHKKYGKVSPKMIADGQAVPKGGGQYLVGHAYRVAGHTYVPSEMTSYTAVGMASWYGAAFHGRRTANGEIYDMASITAAHPTMPLPSYARVTNLSNGYSLIVRVNDRGPYHGGRVMDVSSRTADVLGFKGAGTGKLKVEYMGRAPLEGSDDNMLLASLRTDGSGATIDGLSGPVMVASEAPNVQGPSLFSALFGGGSQAQPAPPPAPPPAPVAPAPVAAPSPPQAVEIAAEREPAPAPETPRPPAALAAAHPRENVPLPPPRPFDLSQTGSAPPAAAVAAAPRPKASAPSATASAVKVLPPRRPELHASAEKALYFADPASDRVKRLTRAAFDRVKPAREPTGED